MEITTTIKGAILRHKLASILIVGIVIRLILMPITAHPFDVFVWYNNSMSLLKNGPLTLQAFPPLWYHYMMVPIAYSYGWLSTVFSSVAIPMSSLPNALNYYPNFGIQFVPGLLFNSIVKIPFLISDIAITFLLYKIVRQLTTNKGLAQKAALLWFLNPFVIWISAGWGMWDTLPALCSLAAFYLMLTKRIPWSAVFISLGVALKLYPALFLVPLGIFLFKSSSASEKWLNCLKFYLVFAAVALFLFLPYLGMMSSFFTGYFAPTPAQSGVLTNPVDNPLGFGLIYWSLYGLNRLIHFPINSEFITFATLAPLVIVAASLIFVYYRTAKRSFLKPAYDLAFAMLLPVVALFLSYRVICEQWFVWAIPLLILVYIFGHMNSSLYWGVSIIGLVYVFLNCPFPFFFLPLSPWYTDTLLSFVYAYWTIDSARIAIQAVLGCAFSGLLVFIIWQFAKREYAGIVIKIQSN